MSTTDVGGFARQLGIVFTKETKDRVEGTMPIDSSKFQPWGFVHGGCTISFLESLASRAAEMNADLDNERPFGVDVHVKHKKPGQKGMMTGYAELDHVERNKQFWTVVALDDEGDTISDGVIITKIVTLARLEEKERERHAAKAAQSGE